MKHLICFSGGHSSALAAIEVSRKYGKDNTILLNHDIHPSVEDSDIKRFKRQISDYLDIPITFANMKDVHHLDQFDISVRESAFQVGIGETICTSRLKSEPFKRHLKQHFPDGTGVIIYYGFDASETVRIQRRTGILGVMGYRTDYPLALWKERTIHSTTEIGISPPLTYSTYKHANCTGCIKAGKQHWYVVFCTRPDVWEKAKWSEDQIGHTILKGESLESLETLFSEMKNSGIPPTEHIKSHLFWSMSKKAVGDAKIGRIQMTMQSCDCTDSLTPEGIG